MAIIPETDAAGSQCACALCVCVCACVFVFVRVCAPTSRDDKICLYTFSIIETERKRGDNRLGACQRKSA